MKMTMIGKGSRCVSDLNVFLHYRVMVLHGQLSLMFFKEFILGKLLDFSCSVYPGTICFNL